MSAFRLLSVGVVVAVYGGLWRAQRKSAALAQSPQPIQEINQSDARKRYDFIQSTMEVNNVNENEFTGR